MALAALAALFALSSAGCNPFAKKADADAGATKAGGSTATTAGTEDRPLDPAAAAKKALDATPCNPGTSLDPVDKGKTISSDQFKYTLLDVRTDSVELPMGKGEKTVLLVKLEVENLTAKQDLNLSVTDVDLSREKPGPDRVKEKELVYKTDFFYPRPKACVDLGADVDKGKIPPGKKVVGYYVYDAGDAPYKSLWFSARNVSAESPATGTYLKVTGSLRIK